MTNKEKSIVALCGFAGSGKDTVADILVNSYGYTKVSFASPLKDAVAAIFKWDRELLEGGTQESRKFREQIDPWWSSKLNIPQLTPRWVLQNIGLEVMRKHFHEDIWILSAEKALEDIQGDIVVTDARFLNEFSMLKSKGAEVGAILRPEAYPSWYNSYMSGGDIPDGVHQSEIAWLDAEIDFQLYNDGTIEELNAVVKTLFDGEESK